jgi:hypothetical protein
MMVIQYYSRQIIVVLIYFFFPHLQSNRKPCDHHTEEKALVVHAYVET